MEGLTKEVASIWATLSLVTAGIAQGKNRTGFGWWILSLIIGPLALLILLFMPKLQYEPEAAEQ